MTIRCLLVDDEPPAIRVLDTLIERIPQVEVVGRCFDAIEAFDYLTQNEVDLVFLDIEMPEMSGLSLIRSMRHPPAFVFVTAYREYAVEAFEVSALDYLVKPVAFDRLLQVIEKFRAQIKSNVADEAKAPKRNLLTIPVDGKETIVLMDQIRYIESVGDYVRFHLDDERLVTRATLKDLEERLADSFIRIHRSYLVAVDRIQAFSSDMVHLQSVELPIGHTYKAAVHKRLRLDE